MRHSVDVWERVVGAWGDLCVQELMAQAPQLMTEAMYRATPEEIDAAIDAIDPAAVADIIRRAEEIRLEEQHA